MDKYKSVCFSIAFELSDIDTSELNRTEIKIADKLVEIGMLVKLDNKYYLT